MKHKRRVGELEQLPRREALSALARHYHHLQNEHKRAPLESSTRRRIEERLLDVRQRFDRLLDEWVPEEELREQWRNHLHNRAPQPDGPTPIRPLVFRGRSDELSEVEVRRNDVGDLDVVVDGSLSVRVAAEKEFTATVPPVRFRLDKTVFYETFAVSDAALDALADFVETEGTPPPWEHVPELLSDGLVDLHVAVTPRGRRALVP